MERRTFIKNTAVVVASSVLLPRISYQGVLESEYRFRINDVGVDKTTCRAYIWLGDFWEPIDPGFRNHPQPQPSHMIPMTTAFQGKI